MRGWNDKGTRSRECRIDAPGSPIGIIAYGTSHAAIMETRDQLRAEEGIETDYLRIRAFPFPQSVRDFVESHERVYVVDQNRDGQMKMLLGLEMPDLAPQLTSIRHYTGMPLDARTVTEAVVALEKTVTSAESS